MLFLQLVIIKIAKYLINNKQCNPVHLYKFRKYAQMEILGWKRVNDRWKKAYGNPALYRRMGQFIVFVWPRILD
jgi:hypothetical protein